MKSCFGVLSFVLYKNKKQPDDQDSPRNCPATILSTHHGHIYFPTYFQYPPTHSGVVGVVGWGWGGNNIVVEAVVKTKVGELG